MARRMSGGRFKRRSAMKMLHNVTETFTLVGEQAAGTVLGYQQFVRQLSAKYGRNMPQACTFRLVGFRASILMLGELTTDVGATYGLHMQYVTPSRHRVNAHEAIMREFVADVRDDSEWSRGRQLLVGFDSVQTPDAAESVLMRNDVATRMYLIGASAAPGALGIFADYNAKHPKPEGTGALNQPDQDLYTDPASQVLDVITGHATMYTAPYEEIEVNSLDVFAAFGTYNGPLTVGDWEWWAPAGTYLPVMCGMTKWVVADSPWPDLQVATLEGSVTSEQIPEYTRGTATLIVQTFLEGWTPLSKK